MVFLRSSQPSHNDLLEFVESFHHYTVAEGGEESSFMIPEGVVEIVFHLGATSYQTRPTVSWEKRSNSFVGGIHNQAWYLKTIGVGQLFSIRFNPGGFSLFTREAVHNFQNQLITLSELWGRDGDDFEDQIMNATTDEERIDIAESFLSQQLMLHKNLDFLNTVKYLDRNIGNQSIKELADMTSHSESNFRALFNRIIGCSPKEFQIIRRLNQAFIRKQSYDSLTSLSYNLGYHDQSHFIRECHRVTGFAPGELLNKKLITGDTLYQT